MANTGYLITEWEDINPHSPTYGQRRSDRVRDIDECAIEDTSLSEFFPNIPIDDDDFIVKVFMITEHIYTNERTYNGSSITIDSFLDRFGGIDVDYIIVGRNATGYDLNRIFHSTIKSTKYYWWSKDNPYYDDANSLNSTITLLNVKNTLYCGKLRMYNSAGSSNKFYCPVVLGAEMNPNSGTYFYDVDYMRLGKFDAKNLYVYGNLREVYLDAFKSSRNFSSSSYYYMTFDNTGNSADEFDLWLPSMMSMDDYDGRFSCPVFSNFKGRTVNVHYGKDLTKVGWLARLGTTNKANFVNIFIDTEIPPQKVYGGGVGATYTGDYTDFAVYVPDVSYEYYKTATNWSSIADKIHPMSSYNKKIKSKLKDLEL